MLPVALGFALLMGLSLALLGGGGTILTVPVLVYGLGFPVKEAVAMSLVVVGAASLVGAIGSWRAGRVRWRVALIFGSVAMAGTYLGARLAMYVSAEFQLALFAATMLAAAWFMYPRRSRRQRLNDAEARQPGSTALIGAEGLAVGVLTGLVGIGGGFMIVPALVLLGGLQMKEAVGTSLVIMTMKSATGTLGYLGQVELDAGFAALFTGIAIAGILAGTRLIRYASPAVLQRAFSVLLLVAGSWMLYQNRNVVLAPLSSAAAPATNVLEVSP